MKRALLIMQTSRSENNEENNFNTVSPTNESQRNIQKSSGSRSFDAGQDENLQQNGQNQNEVSLNNDHQRSGEALRLRHYDIQERNLQQNLKFSVVTLIYNI